MTTRRQLKRQIRKSLREIAEETINVGGVDWSRDDLLDAISDYSKELGGYRDRGAIERLASAPLEDLVAHYEDMADSEEGRQLAQSDSDAELGHEDSMHPLERGPKQQGMGRRTENKMRVTKNDLRRRIRKALNEGLNQQGIS